VSLFFGRLTQNRFGYRQLTPQQLNVLKIYLKRNGAALPGIEHYGNPSVRPLYSLRPYYGYRVD
jgi:hypothetical protein